MARIVEQWWTPTPTEEANKVDRVQCGSHPVAANQALWLRLLHSLAAQ
jgi:hypothetical protein